MAKFVSNKDESVRIFKNPILEYFSHIHPLTPIVFYVPIIIYFGMSSINQKSFLPSIIFFSIGVILWTLLEYTLHRFVFHYQPKTAWGKYIHFLSHGIHHDYPKDSTRLVMPLLVSIPIGIGTFLLFYLIFDIHYSAAFSGIVFGYVCYDSIHYATHHFQMKGRVGKFLKTYHLRHHYSDDHSSYGVSNPLWDYVFRTIPRKNNTS